MPAGEKPAEAPPVPSAPAPAPVMATAPAPAPAAPAAPAVPAPKLTWGGLVDTYYMYLFNPASGMSSLTSPMGRAFDVNSNSFNLSLAKVSLNASLDPVSLQLDIGYGGAANVVNGSVPSPGGQLSSTAFFVEQAYGEISLPGNLTIDFGKFATTAGAEVIEANKNWLYSRSFLFTIIPFVHTGVRANLKLNDQLTLQASLVNNWGGTGDPDNNGWKTVGLSASVTVNPMVALVATTYIGKEAAQMGTSTPADTTILVDVVGAFTLSDKLGLNVNFDYVKAPPLTSNGDDHQVGVSVMGRYVISDHLNFAARGEFLQNHFGGASSNVEEGTVMLGIDVGKNFELRPELRGDFSGDPIFGYDAAAMATTKKNQFTGTIGALTWF
jgi:hypothetical protein